jgi:hypothetical protein
MTQAVAFKETDNGRERITDGLWTHHGPAVFSGPLTLPPNSVGSAQISDGAVGTADLASGAASGGATVTATAALSTSSSSLVSPPSDSLTYTPSSANSLLLAIYQGTFMCTTAGAIAQFALSWRGIHNIYNHWFNVANTGQLITLHTFLMSPGVGLGTLQFMLATNAGTLSAYTTNPRQLSLLELKR